MTWYETSYEPRVNSFGVGLDVGLHSLGVRGLLDLVQNALEFIHRDEETAEKPKNARPLQTGRFHDSHWMDALQPDYLTASLAASSHISYFCLLASIHSVA